MLRNMMQGHPSVKEIVVKGLALAREDVTRVY